MLKKIFNKAAFHYEDQGEHTVSTPSKQEKKHVKLWWDMKGVIHYFDQGIPLW